MFAAPRTCYWRPTRPAAVAMALPPLSAHPDLANDAEGTIEQASELWRRLGRRNSMIKVPATPLAGAARRRGTPPATALGEHRNEGPNILGCPVRRDAGIDLNAVTAALEHDGVQAFWDSYDALLSCIGAKARMCGSDAPRV
jgi:hypothetical protein